MEWRIDGTLLPPEAKAPVRTEACSEAGTSALALPRARTTSKAKKQKAFP